MSARRVSDDDGDDDGDRNDDAVAPHSWRRACAPRATPPQGPPAEEAFNLSCLQGRSTIRSPLRAALAPHPPLASTAAEGRSCTHMCVRAAILNTPPLEVFNLRTTGI